MNITRQEWDAKVEATFDTIQILWPGILVADDRHPRRLVFKTNTAEGSIRLESSAEGYMYPEFVVGRSSLTIYGMEDIDRVIRDLRLLKEAAGAAMKLLNICGILL